MRRIRKGKRTNGHKAVRKAKGTNGRRKLRKLARAKKNGHRSVRPVVKRKERKPRSESTTIAAVMTTTTEADVNFHSCAMPPDLADQTKGVVTEPARVERIE